MTADHDDDQDDLLAPGDEEDGDPSDGSPTIDDPNQSSFFGAPEEAPPPPAPEAPAATPVPDAPPPADPASAGPPAAEPAAAEPPPGEPMSAAPAEPSESAPDYQVLARKYRPTSFDELIGQEAMVRVLTNAFKQDRVAHAFVLTGVRGIGKTTTARIIAKCLNATGGPTISPDPDDEQCLAITADRHPDVLEVDAASRTGVDDIREILDGVRYRPVFGRYKVYIVDEVHMLSRNAFNALLKTLEEPPEHVKFIFCTTEIRKVPVTVLSRCQRFDLRRIGSDELMAHFAGIAEKEGASLDEGALRLIARAADGSVRDGLSLLDQAISAFGGGGATVAEDQVRSMLGTADAAAVFDIFEALMGGRAAEALGGLRTLYDAGADPLAVLQDLLEMSHWITRVKLVPEAADDPAVSELERTRGRAMAEALGVAALSRAWQILLKGVGEAQRAPDAMSATEMALIRLAHAADMPPPADILRRLEKAGEGGPATRAPAAPSGDGGGTPAGSQGGSAMAGAAGAGGAAPRRAPEADPAPQEAPRAQAAGAGDPKTFRELVDMFAAKREAALRGHLYMNVHLVSYEPGRLEYRPEPTVPREFSGQVLACLRAWCGQHWQVVTSRETGDATLAEQDRAEEEAVRQEAASHPVVRAALELFEGAQIERVIPRDMMDGTDVEADMSDGGGPVEGLDGIYDGDEDEL